MRSVSVIFWMVLFGGRNVVSCSIGELVLVLVLVLMNIIRIGSMLL